MKKSLPILLLAILFLPGKEYSPLAEKDLFRAIVNSHQYAVRPHLNKEQIKAMPKQDRPDLAWEQNYLETMDPALGRPAPERLLPIYQQIAQSRNSLTATPGAVTTPWTERGPSNVGGRTRAIAYDPNDVTGKKVWAGGVTGGLWYNNDITLSSSSWTAVNDFWDNIAITAIAFDPNNTNTIYVGTGEGWGTGSSRGAGVWKSTDGGTTWNHLSATSSFYYVNDLVVRDESGTGVLYVALRGNYHAQSNHGSSQQGLQRSSNGGTSFTQVLPNVPSQSINFAAADIEIAADNSIWIGTTTSSYGATDRGGGRILSSTNGTTWTTRYTATNGERVEIACAPSDANYVYGLIESGNVLDEVVRTTNGGTSWTSRTEPNDVDNGIPSTDFTRGQAWYDLIIAVDPNDRSTIIAGGIDLFRSTDGASNWTQISKWSNNNNLSGLSCSNVHADQHQVIFKPGSSSQVLFGNDGGVYYTNSVSSAGSSNVIFDRNNGYNVTQFYACALHPTAGSNYALAGAQDNGTQQFNNSGINATNEVTGGDGAFCFIDQTDANYQITSYVYNSYWRSTNGGSSFGSRFQSDQTTGKFINPTDYDDNQNILYSARTSSTINRVTNMTGSPSIGNFTVAGMSTMASHLRVSPYTTSSTTLFVGTSSGDLYKITNADGGSPSTSNVGSGLPSGNISCVEIGANENELLVTFTNYGLTSVWYTSNGGTSWASKEGNLPDMPVRWALFNPNDRNEVILATEVGVWSTSNLNSSSPSWTSSNSGLANVRVDMLQIRQSDFEVIASTYGRGLFSSSGFAPSVDFGYSKQYPCTGETVLLGDSTLGAPTAWTWKISPSTFSFTSGTNANSQNPEVIFNTAGWYSIKLLVTKGGVVDSVELSQAIRAGGYDLPFSEDFETISVSEWQVDNPDNSNTWTLASIGGTSPGTLAAGFDNATYNAAGQKDGLISPAIDLSNYTSVNLDFEHAYRRYSATYTDSLAIHISMDCGSTWNRIAAYGEDGTGNFATGSDYTFTFTPSASSDWCSSITNSNCISLDISAYAGNPDVRVKFENITGYGNNMYVDNVNITGTIAAPTADFSASQTSVCSGSSVTFTDLSTGASGWSWSFTPNTVTYLNSTSSSSQNPQVSFNAAGNYQVSLTSTNTAGSDVETKNSYIGVSTGVVPSVSVAASSTNICAGTNVTFTATPTNGGGSAIYQWKVNGSNVGGNNPTYSSSTLANNDIVTVEMQSSASCPTLTTVTSNSSTMVVNSPVTPAIGISASATSICMGTMVTFTASPTSGGGTPTYQWKINGSNVGTNSSSFSSSTLANSDVVTCELTSSISCVSSSTALSSGITVTVSGAVTPSVAFTASSNSICAGSSVTFTATPTNGGGSPAYQWKVNGTNAGTNSPTFTSSTLINSDVITVEMTSGLTCATPALATSAPIAITVITPPMINITTVLPIAPLCAGDSLSLTATTNNFGQAGSGSWSGPGVSNDDFIASSAGTGTHTLTYTYTYTNAPSCTNSQTMQVTVENVPKPTITANGMTLNCNESGYTYQWLKSGTPIGGANSQSYTVTGNGNYSVQIGLTSCNDQSDPTVIQNFGSDEYKALVDFKLYPNPTAGLASFEMTNPGVSSIQYELIAFNGAIVMQKEIAVSSAIKEDLDLSKLANGIYTLRITAGDISLVERLGKQ